MFWFIGPTRLRLLAISAFIFMLLCPQLVSGEDLDASRIFAKPPNWIDVYELFGLTKREVAKKISDLQAKDKQATFKVADDARSICISDAGGFISECFVLKYAGDRIVAVEYSWTSCNGRGEDKWIDSREKALLKALVYHSQQMDVWNWRLRTGPKMLENEPFSAFDEANALQQLGRHQRERAHILRLLGMLDEALGDEIGSKEVLADFEKVLPRLTSIERDLIIGSSTD